MIPLHKLRNLPRSQCLRKTAKLFEEVERRFLAGTILPDEWASLWANLKEILAFATSLVPGEAGEALRNIQEALDRKENGAADIRRNLALVHYALARELGGFPSEWDFDAVDAAFNLDPEKRQVFPGMTVFLEDIRSPFNVGAMFRTAESFGAERILLSPLCADPEHSRAKRTAMGCVSVMPWTRTEANPFKKSGVFAPETVFFALETGGTRLDDFNFPQKGVMIVGSEELGVSPEALAAADASLGRVSIPVLGAKGSLNVSVAFGIALYAWAEQLAVRK